MVAGSGVGKRLHAPIWAEYGFEVEFFRVPSDLNRFAQLQRNVVLIIVATPPSVQLTHARQILAVAPNVPLLLEKPAGIGLSELLRFKDDMAFNKAVVRVNYQLRFHDLSQYMMNGGESLKSIKITYRSGASSDAQVPQWYKSENSGGGLRRAVASHLIDLLFYCRLLSTEGSVISVAYTPTSLELLFRCGKDFERSITLDVQTKQPFGAMNVLFVNKDGSGTSFDFPTAAIQSFKNASLASETQRHTVEMMRTSYPGIWQDAYREFVRSFVRNGLSFDSRSATIDSALKVYSVLDDVLSRVIQVDLARGR
jgi:predicted dehydrogenase